MNSCTASTIVCFSIQICVRLCTLDRLHNATVSVSWCRERIIHLSVKPHFLSYHQVKCAQKHVPSGPRTMKSIKQHTWASSQLVGMGSELHFNCEAALGQARAHYLLSQLDCYLKISYANYFGSDFIPGPTTFFWDVFISRAWEADPALEHFPCFRCLLHHLMPHRVIFREELCHILILWEGLENGIFSWNRHLFIHPLSFLTFFYVFITSADVNQVLCSSVTTYVNQRQPQFMKTLLHFQRFLCLSSSTLRIHWASRLLSRLCM